MTWRHFFFRLRNLLRHPLNPAPVVVICTGFWLPLDFLKDSNRLLAIQTITGRLHVMATAIVWDAILTIVGIALVYILAALFALICRISFQKTALNGLWFVVNVTILVPCLHLFRFASLLPNARWVPFIVPTTVLIGALWMTYANLQLGRMLFLPKLLTSILLPVSLLLVAQESSHAVHFPENRSARSGDVHVQQPPDIVLLTIDTLSARHLHTYGYQRPTSPNLDAFSARSIVFDNFYADANWTHPGIASILNGVRPWTHEGDLDVPSRALTEKQNLLTILHTAGYDVKVVQSNMWANLATQGIWSTAHETFLASNFSLFRWLPFQRLPSAMTAQFFGLPKVIIWIESNFLRYPIGKDLPYLSASENQLRKTSSGHPLFFWLHIMTPHDPYAASAPFLGTFDASPGARTYLTSQPEWNFVKHIDQRRQDLLRARYDEAVLQTDDVIGRFIQLLKQEGRFEHSLIVVTADHGESFNLVYGGHGGSLLTEELIRVPCLIKLPFSYTPKHESRLMEQADLLPTILTYAGLPLPEGDEGRPYPDKPDNVPAFSMNRDFQPGEHTLNVAMRERDWKYVIHLGRWKHPWPQQELYNLAQDPDEKANLIGSQPERAEAMRQRVLAEVQRHGISLSEYQH